MYLISAAVLSAFSNDLRTQELFLKAYVRRRFARILFEFGTRIRLLEIVLQQGQA